MKTAVGQATLGFDDIDYAVDTNPPMAGLDRSEAPAVLPNLRRRNGRLVEWDTNKIEIAIRKAFLACELESTPAIKIAKSVEKRVRGELEVDIELVQDIVQEELMRARYWKVAEAYIVYRDRRRVAREREQLEKPIEVPSLIEEESPFALIEAVDESGQPFLWSGNDLRHRIEYARQNLDISMSSVELEQELRRSLGTNVTMTEIRKVIILNAKSLMERDSDFAFFAARILLTFIYEECLGWDIVRDGVAKLQTMHASAMEPYLKFAVELKRLSPDLLTYDIPRLAAALDPTADLDFDFLGVQTLYDRYLLSDKSSGMTRRMETPQMFWMRVSMGLFKADTGDREARVLELYDLYKSRRFCSSTPTLFNSGTLRSQLSSCYLYKIDDSLDSIVVRGIAENALLSKWAGGLGGSWTAVRGTGAYIQGTNGESQGVIPFLKMHNDQLVAVNQGGKRAGSGCAYLESWHSDIFDFLELRRNTGDDRRRTHDMNTANWIPDLFMKRMEARGTWTLFHSSQVPDLHDLYGKAFEDRYVQYEAMAERGEIYGKKIDALELWKRMLQMIFETGHPWITFKDPCNVRSPQDHVGVVHSSNLCTEITLNTDENETAVCNLGSIVLDTHLTPSGEIDHAKLRETVRVAVRALDNVIDINFYPTEPSRRSNMRHRPVGLGVMGLQYALYQKGIGFSSDEALAFNDEFMEAIAYYAYEASSDLAAERGTYETYKGSKWDRGLLPQDTVDLLESERGLEIEVTRGGKLDWTPVRDKIKRQGMRNSNVIAIAPTATIANIMGTSPCIEPMYKNMFAKSNLSGDFLVVNPFLVADLKKLNLWTSDVIEQVKYYDGELEHIAEIPQEIKDRYVTAFRVPFESLIDAAARRQKWIDQSQSVNLFMGEPDMKALSHMYRRAWHTGLKTTYYLRTLGASNIEKATVNVKKRTFTEEEKNACSIEAMRNGEECEACQ
jgi:ribonucleoside-diphosphate reductase alpha chain